VHRDLADAWRLFEDVPGLEYAARYEHARSLVKSGQREEGRKAFRTLYEQTLREDKLPLIDPDFRQSLLGDGKESDLWGELIRQTVGKLIEQKHRAAGLVLAWQCWQLGDQPLANHLYSVALADVKDDKQRLVLTLLGLEFLWQTAQFVKADEVLQKLLDDPEQSKRPALWRLAANLAERRDRRDRQLLCLEKALELEYHNLPERLRLDHVRHEYETLLGHYRDLANAMITLKVQPPPDFLARVVRTADRWRALDDNTSDACQMAASILRRFGDRDLAWDYLTTPVAARPNEAAPWTSMARDLARTGELALADRAFAAAFEAEPTNAQLLWDRAQNLRESGQEVEAKKLFRQLAEGAWQPRFQGLQREARWQLERR
jgi:Tfp pilus assembly protein PilF